MNNTNTYRKIFVVGCPRSGTTWTGKMISKHASIIKLPGESYLYKLFYDPFTHLKSLKFRKRLERSEWIFKHYGLLPILIGFNSDRIWSGIPRTYNFYKWINPYNGPHIAVGYDKLLELIELARAGEGDDLTKAKKLVGLILDHAFFDLGGNSETVLLEKTPMHIRYAKVILQSFPEAKVIEVVRDVRDVRASWQARSKRDDWAKKPTNRLVKQWISCVKRGEKIESDPSICNRFFRVRYEDLRQDTPLYLQKIFDFSELPISTKALNEIVDECSIEKIKDKGEGKSVRKGIVGSWREELTEADIELCTRLAGPYLKKLGYSLT